MPILFLQIQHSLRLTCPVVLTLYIIFPILILSVLNASKTIQLFYKICRDVVYFIKPESVVERNIAGINVA